MQDSGETDDMPQPTLITPTQPITMATSQTDSPPHATDHTHPILVLVNPHSGRGKSLKIYETKLAKFLDSRNIKHEVFVTTYDLRVKDYLGSKSLADLRRYRSIVVVSGDGLLYETVNALMSRPDWPEVMSIPLGVVPTGSGNGLAYTLIRQLSSGARVSRQSEAIDLCCEQVAQTHTCKSDLVRIQYGDSTTIWSFLSIGWGLLADIDVDSEWLRCTGELRFTVYGLLRSLTSKSRRGKLSYQLGPARSPTNLTNSVSIPVDSQTPKLRSRVDDVNDSSDDEQRWIHIEDKFACVYAVHQSYVSRVTNFAPESTLNDSLMYLTYVRGKLSPCQVVKYLLAIEDGSQGKLPFVEVVPVNKIIFQPLVPSKIVVDGEVITWNETQGPLTAEVVPGVLNLLWNSDIPPKELPP